MQKFLFPEFRILDLGIQNSTDKESWIQYVVGAGKASLSTSCRRGWLSFNILKIACLISTNWPYQHYELLSLLAHPNHA